LALKERFQKDDRRFPVVLVGWGVGAACSTNPIPPPHKTVNLPRTALKETFFAGFPVDIALERCIIATDGIVPISNIPALPACTLA